jgi:hypothetical protein
MAIDCDLPLELTSSPQSSGYGPLGFSVPSRTGDHGRGGLLRTSDNSPTLTGLATISALLREVISVWWAISIAYPPSLLRPQLGGSGHPRGYAA